MNKGRKKAEWEGAQCSRCGGNNGGGSDRCAHCGAVMDPNPQRKATLHTAADGATSFCRLCGKQLQQMESVWYALRTSPEQRSVGQHYCVPARMVVRPGEFGPDGILVPGVPGGEGGQYDAPAGTIFDAGGNPIKVATRRTALSLTNVGFEGGIGSNIGVGTAPDGQRIRFRLSPKDAKDLAFILTGDLAINFSGIDIEESDIIRGDEGMPSDSYVDWMNRQGARRTAEADGIDSPSPDSQNGYAESTLPNVEVATAPEDTNMGWIAEGDPNAVTASMGVFEAMFMRGATDQVTSGPLYDAAGKDASLGVGHVWTNTSCPAYKSYDPKDCTCSTKSASRKVAGPGHPSGTAFGWPRQGDNIICPKCGSDSVSFVGSNLGSDVVRGHNWTGIRCNSCATQSGAPLRLDRDGGPSETLWDKQWGWKAASRKQAEANGIDSPSPQSQNGYAETTLTDVSVGSAPDDTNLGWITDGDPNAEDEASFDAPDNPIANEAAYKPSVIRGNKTSSHRNASINAHFAALVTAGKAYDKGMADGKVGDGIQYNPYPFDSSDGAEWIRGYRDAQGLQPGQKASSRKQAGENDRPAGAAPMVDQVTNDPEDDTDMFGGEWVHEGSRRQALHPDDDPSQGPGYLDDAPDYLGDPPGMDPTSFGDFDMFAPEEPKQASRKQAMPAPADLGVSVGSIFYSSWGYDQTNVSFYEVVGLTPASVKIREVAKSYVEQNGPAGNKVIPQPGNYIGGEMTKRLQNSGFRDAAITINSSETAWLWDGKPQYETDSVYGH